MRHLPAPSLASALTALDEAERTIRMAMPSQGTTSGEVRAEWAWGRLRMPTQEFVSTAVGFLPWFGGATTAAQGGAAPQPQHPSTTFSFLYEVTVRVLRLQAVLPPVPESTFAFAAAVTNARDSAGSNSAAQAGQGISLLASLLPARALSPSSPNTILSTLVPQLLTRWSALLSRISGAVNDEGRMFGQEMVRGWIVQLESLGLRSNTVSSDMRDEERAVRTAFGNMSEALVDRIGWLVGVQRVVGQMQATSVAPAAAAAHHQQQHALPWGAVPQHGAHSVRMDEEEEEL